jgi:hypothetical protein
VEGEKSVLQGRADAVESCSCPGTARRAPSFLIIGAQKCGTTTLHAYLAEHPQIAMSAEKELHYFDREANYPDEVWYRGQFPPIDGVRAVGEATPIYCFWPGTIARIWRFDPALKLIMIMRNPIDRAISQYWMNRRWLNETMPMRAAFRLERARIAPTPFEMRHRSYLARGRYRDQLENVCRWFPREQLLLLRLEDLQRDAAATLRAVTDFVSVSPFANIAMDKRENTLDYPAAEEQVRDELREYFLPMNARLHDEYGVLVDDWQ